uniref:Uncharacterized protein n=1 Tax=Globisporangium ultimum (strain ATCC 200006 / CBS 805.95 / DAOM BR144) TaxID=431595 RepID=K3WZN3_GLOUD
MYCIAFLDFSALCSFYINAVPIQDGGLYVRDVSHSIAFGSEKCPEGSDPSCGSCSTIVVYAILVYHMLPFVILIGLPATGLRPFEPFKRQDGVANAKVTRTLYLQMCELICAGILTFDILVFYYFLYSFFEGNNFNCPLLRVHLYGFSGVLAFVGTILEITYFARFREHVKMQLGAFKEKDQTGNVRSRVTQKRARCKSERTRITDDIRKKLYKETELGNLRALENVLTYAQIRLGDGFAKDVYRSAPIWCGLFGSSVKNPLHVAAQHGNVNAMDLFVRAGFQVNSFDKVSRVRFSTGNLFCLLPCPTNRPPSSEQLS